MMATRSATALAFLALSACATDEPQPACGGAGTVAPAVEPGSISLSTTQCFGYCPVVEIRLQSDGGLAFEGSRRAPGPSGTLEAAGWVELGPDAFARTKERLLELGFMGLRDSYTGGADCGAFLTDMPSRTATLMIGGVTKSVTHYEGCRRFEDEEKVNAVFDVVYEALRFEEWVETELSLD